MADYNYNTGYGSYYYPNYMYQNYNLQSELDKLQNLTLVQKKSKSTLKTNKKQTFTGDIKNFQTPSKTEKKSSNGWLGFGAGAATAAIITFLLTRGRVKLKPSSINKIKTKSFTIEHMKSYANGVKNIYGNKADKVYFFNGGGFKDFINKNKNKYPPEQIAEYLNLTEKDILACAVKGTDILAGSEVIFRNDAIAQDVISAFKGHSMYAVRFN